MGNEDEYREVSFESCTSSMTRRSLRPLLTVRNLQFIQFSMRHSLLDVISLIRSKIRTRFGTTILKTIISIFLFTYKPPLIGTDDVFIPKSKETKEEV